ncbi:MAG: 4-(cytidine 5'-diphospho)-2-C-methyl-D-erythritol kinase [Deltaproteobacteria bacterium]|nr:4-(cytidine 5'-diphospho)-2-C-methyl-D-erythritol kinase [Deltaproteobacteria bacterium]
MMLHHQRLRAPAKINLALRVVGRRADGYHLLDSVFLPLDWGDEIALTIAEANAAVVACELRTTAEAPLISDGLASEAARRYLAQAKVCARVSLEIDKRIWISAGLGGGSSDAATVLCALNRHFAALSSTELSALALSLGADVPYFLTPLPARVRGVGEQISPLDGLPALDLLLVNPKMPLSTAAVFAAHRQPPSPPLPETLDLSDTSWITNDLLPAACALCPAVAAAFEALRSFDPLFCSLSGSGATLFAGFATAEQTSDAATQLSEKKSLMTAIVRTLAA